MNRIGDYALLGDGHSAALVGRDGSIDWACFPRFDSPSVFARILDEKRGGGFLVQPEGASATWRSSRAYVPDTNVLVTAFECDGGVLEVTDCMPVRPFDPAAPAAVDAHRSILRRVRATRGRVVARVLADPRFEYASFTPRFVRVDDLHGEVTGGADSLFFTATRPLSFERDRLHARWELAEGEEAWIEAAWAPSDDRRHFGARDAAEMARRLEETERFWRAWIDRSVCDEEHAPVIRRSALALKALIHAPTGAVVAAPTTSLPERIGGPRNWDYRYTWIRDATLTLTSLLLLGLRDEADAFKAWLSRTGAGRPDDLQIMYRIRGQRLIPEFELSHLAGHRDSAPVRIGNGAAGQSQLDCYGQILEAAWLYERAGGDLTDSNWVYLSRVADIVCERWRNPDHGIWEIRDEPRHFSHSKLHCWLALDRALKIAARRKLPVPGDRWEKERAALADFLRRECAPDGWFQQAAGHPVADASTLLFPATGFVGARDPLATRTLQVVRRDLEHDGLVHRYRNADGLEGEEGAFLLCSFWLLDSLIHEGALDEADALLARLLSLANDVGLFAEEADPASGEALGNFPQAFTHMALVSSCSHLAAAKRGEIPFDGTHSWTELALQRMLERAKRRL